MPDPITPVPPETADQLNNVADATDRVSASANKATLANTGLNDILGNVSLTSIDLNSVQKISINIFDKLTQGVSDFAYKLGQLPLVNETSAASFGVMSAAMIKTTEAFRQFGNVDNKRIIGFSEQYEKLFKTMRDSPMTQAAKAAADAIKETLEKLGMAPRETEKLSKSLQEGKKAALDFAESILIGADNTLHYQNAMLQTAATQGGMQKLLEQTGRGFEHLNDVTAKQLDIMNKSMGATGLDKEHLQPYMDVLKNLPGGMTNFGDSMDIAGRKTSFLTAAIQYMHGSQRDMVKIAEDMSEAMNNYGLSTENALKYSARMSEVSETLGARVEDVQKAITQSSEAFKSFVYGGADADAMTKGLAEGMEMYVNRLESVGVPVKNAIEMTQNLQGAMSKLNVGQQAFMSQQTGGPGGMQGYFQMEQLMQKDPMAAQRKMEEATRKMLGPIVSSQQAAQSQGAAEQRMRQLMILQQGPLGAQAQDIHQAGAILDSMSKGKLDMSVIKQKGGLEETIKRGAAFEDLSKTKVSQMNVTTDSVMLTGGVVNLTTQQNAFTARSGKGGGSDGSGRGINQEQINELKQFSAAQMDPSHMGSPIKQLIELSSGLPRALKAQIQSYGESLTTKGYSEAKDRDALNKQAKLNNGLPSIEGATQSSGVSEAMKQVQLRLSRSQPGEHDFTPFEDLPAGQQVGRAVQSTKKGSVGKGALPYFSENNSAANTQGIVGMHNNQPIPVVLASGSGITVNFTGKCPHCNWDIHTSQQAAITSSASQSSNKS